MRRTSASTDRRRNRLINAATMTTASDRSGLVTNQSAAPATTRLPDRFQAPSQNHDGVGPQASTNCSSRALSTPPTVAAQVPV